MGAVRGGWLIAVAPVVALLMGAACTFGIDTSGLAGDGGGALDVTGIDAPADAPADARRESGRRDGGGSDAPVGDGGVDATDAADAGGATDAPSGPCEITPVQAVPGVGVVYHVILDGGTKQQNINETSGNLLVAIAYGGQGPGMSVPASTAPNTEFSVTDTLGNQYFAAPMFENSRSNQAAMQIFFAPNIKGGANTVTATAKSGGGLVEETGLFLEEFSGAATKDVVDISSGQMAPAVSTQVVPGPMTTAAGCDWVVGAYADGHISEEMSTAGPGWTLSNTDYWDPAVQVDPSGGTVPAGTVVNAEMDLKTSDDGWVAAQVAFRSASTPALTQPDKIGFDSPPRTVMPGACSGAVTIHSVHGTTPTRTATGIPMSLSGPGLSFYVDPACSYPITSLSIGAGTEFATFYFKASSAGSPAIKATPTPSTALAAQSQTEKVL